MRTSFAKSANAKSRATAAADRHGAMLLIMMICLLLTTMIGGSLLKLALTQRKQSRRANLRLQAAWLAESAIDRAAAQIGNDAAYSGEQWELPAESFGQRRPGSVRIQVETAPNKPTRRYVTVVADYPSGTDQRARVGKRVTVDLSNELEN